MSLFIEMLVEYWKPCLEIFVFFWAYYILLRFLRNTGGLQILRGLLVIFVFYWIVRALQLDTIARVMTEILPLSLIALMILFQSELRRGLTRMGQTPIFKIFLKEEKIIDEIVKSVSAFAQKRVGALIAMEREISLKPYADSGILLDAVVSFELLSTVFTPMTPLHDGGVVLQGSRVQAVGCLFPLSQSTRISKTMGTRHRAALGLTEETDATVIVVSEESGTISIAEKGALKKDVSPDMLRRSLTALYFPQRQAHRHWLSMIRGEQRKSGSKR